MQPIKYHSSVITMDCVLPEDQMSQIAHMVMEDQHWSVGTPIVTDIGVDSGLQNVNHLYVDNVPVNGYLLDAIVPILNRLKVSHLVRAKFNFTYPQPERQEGWHYDLPRSMYYPGMKIAVINFTTCNASTKLEGYGEVDSIANTCVIFDADKYHAGCSFDDAPYRLTLNIVYFPELSNEEKIDTVG